MSKKCITDMGKKLKEDVLHRFLRKKNDAVTNKEVLEYINSSSENAREIFVLEELFQAESFRKKMNDAYVNNAYENVKKKIAEKKDKRRFVFMPKILIEYAAAFLILLLGFWFLYNSTFIDNSFNGTVLSVNNNDSIKQFILDDGTKVWLNKGAVLVLSPRFDSSRRYVRLEGEAFFDVEKNPKSPFIVFTKKMKVSVFGTSFNVNTNDIHGMTSVALSKGLVQVSGLNNEGEVLMSPGQKAYLDSGKKEIIVDTVNTDIESEWKSNMFFFENSTINSIVSKLIKYYGINIKIKSNRVDNTYSGAVNKSSTLEETLNLLKSVIPMKYYKSEDKNEYEIYVD